MMMTLQNDRQLKDALGQKLPVMLYFYDSREKLDKPLENALETVDRKNAGELSIVRVDIAAYPQVHNRYDSPAAPALVTLVKGFLGHKTKSQAGAIRPKDVRLHADYLLGRGPEPVEVPPAEKPEAPAKKSATRAVSDSTFKRDVLKANVPVLVDFWAPWCAPCRTIAPFMEQVAEEYRGQIRIAKLNVDDNPTTSGSYQVQSIPTLIMFKNGKPIERRTGADARMIRTMIQEALLDD